MCGLVIGKNFDSDHKDDFWITVERLNTTGGYDFNVQADGGNNLLSLAVLMDRAEVVESLFHLEEVDPNLQDINGHAPLRKAADCEHKENVKLLLAGRRANVGWRVDAVGQHSTGQSTPGMRL